jgi:hypothetical protein
MRRSKIKVAATAAAITFALLVVVSIIANAAGGGNSTSSTATSVSQTPEDLGSLNGSSPAVVPTETEPTESAPPAPPHVKWTAKRIVFRVRGYAPSGVSITYGSDSDNRSPQGGMGPLGDGTAVPWEASVKYHADDLYYSLTAQLEGGGNVTAKVYVKLIQHMSDGTTRSGMKVCDTGHASGSYNIADAQCENF